MPEQNILEVMKAHRHTLATKGRLVVDYLLSNPREAAFLSINDVSEQLGVSKGQLVRVARLLGYPGYGALKTALQNTLLEQVNPVALLNRLSSETNQSLAERIYETEVANLKDTWVHLQTDDVARFCESVKKAHNIYCSGWGISSISAENLYSRLRELGLNGFQLRNDCLTLIEQAKSLSSQDVLIVFDLPSYSLRLTEMVHKVKEQGAKIITVTDSAAAPICRDADLSFYVSDNSPTFGSSLISSLFLVHLLTSTLSVAMGEAAKKALQQQAECLKDERVYHPVFGLRY